VSRIGSRYPVSGARSQSFRGADQAEPGILFRQHGRDVMVDGLGGDEQLGGDLGVCVAGLAFTA